MINEEAWKCVNSNWNIPLPKSSNLNVKCQEDSKFEQSKNREPLMNVENLLNSNFEDSKFESTNFDDDVRNSIFEGDEDSVERKLQELMNDLEKWGQSSNGKESSSNPDGKSSNDSNRQAAASPAEEEHSNKDFNSNLIYASKDSIHQLMLEIDALRMEEFGKGDN